MGQKVNPIAIRLGIVHKWTSTWYADSKNYADYLYTDLKVRAYLMKKFVGAGVNRVQIERPSKTARVIIYAARPGVILGKKGGDIEALRKDLSKMMNVPVHVSIEEVGKPDLAAKLVAESIAQQLERRVVFRKAMKRAVQSTLRAGALGIKISVSGRLGGSEIARTEWYREGRVPLHTFRADIDYGLAEAHTTYGIIGVKVWIHRNIVETEAKNEKAPKDEESSGKIKAD